MAQELDQRSRDEHEFWDRRFDDPAAAPDGSEAWPVEERIDAHEPTAPPSPADQPRSRAVPRPLAPEPETPWQRVAEWLRDRSGDPRLGVVALIVIAVVAGFVWYRIGVGGGDDSPPPPRRAAASASAAPDASSRATSATTSPTNPSDGGPNVRVVVHVAGAVVRPGVVELARTTRVIDALEAVGGANADADVDRLNLAAPVVDGSRIYVPRRGEADPGVSDGGAAGAATGPGGAPGAKVNLNTATEAQLEELPGIGPTYAQAIVAERTRRGGFRSVNELREVRGIGEKRFAELAPLVVV